MKREAAEKPSTALLALAVLAAAFLLRFLPVLLWPSMAHPDEVFQSIEQGHRLVFGYGGVPWEFQYGARSWLLPYICAGLIRFSLLFGDSPDIYLKVIGAGFSLLSATSAMCAFLWARRHFTPALALAAAMVPICWVDCIFYGARAMPEPVAASLLVLGLYLAFPGEPIHSRPRFFLAGFLLASSVLLRLQLGPAVAIVWIWNFRQDWKNRVLWLTAGAALAVALDGWFDAVTWSFPFEPLWRNFSFNVLQHGADTFGTRDWWWYFYDYAGAWGGTMPVFLGLALLGARRAKLPFLMALVICAVHAAIPHKETRFLFPTVTLLAICAGFGLVQLELWLRAGIPNGFAGGNGWVVLPSLCAIWLILSGINVFGLDYQEYWDAQHEDALTIANKLYHNPPSCGLGLYGFDMLRIGGYSYLHRPILLYPVAATASPAALAQAAQDFDTVIVDTYLFTRPAENTPPLSGLTTLGYRMQECVGDYCVLRRPGTCKGSAMPGPPAPRNFDLGPVRYPQRQGVNGFISPR